MSKTSSDPSRWLDELPEPEAFTPEEFHAWRGLIRLRETAMREIDRRLQENGDLSLADYGVLVTLATQPQLRLRMSDLGAQRMLTPSGITRVVTHLEKRGLIKIHERENNHIRWCTNTPKILQIFHAKYREGKSLPIS